MLSLLLFALISVTWAPGWSEPMIAIDVWTYYGENRERIEVTGSDTLHLVWGMFDNKSRVGYKVFLPDGTVIHPETMVSNDVWSGYTSSCKLSSDSVALFWREGAPVWFTLRDSTGEELVSTSLLIRDSYVNRPILEASSDSLGRIHCVFEIYGGVCYAVCDPVLGEVFRDTIPGSSEEISNIQVDGNRVHIFYTSGYAVPVYIQYDLEGNITVAPVVMVQNLQFITPESSVTTDSDGNFWCFMHYAKEGASYYVLSLVKVDGASGQVLLIREIEIPDKVDGASGQFLLTRETGTPDLGNWFLNIMPGPDGETLYLMWLAYFQSDHWVYFAIMDKEGNFIEEPYAAYDYSDEKIQQLYCLDATTNEAGDVFAVWSQADLEVGGYWIVLGWLDHNWVEVEEESTLPVDPVNLTLICSSNPFEGSTVFTLVGSSGSEQLSVYDTSGRLIRTLHQTGDGCFLWDGCDSAGKSVSAGSYFAVARSESQESVLQVVKLD
ncbi:hypothetical protein CSA37_04550 [Candidatus Fermentibacteria bacterium]|nr:MAG: hypothetical protein CSA37_06900 [Candidatus Fermentibacteria bacterium]PIE52918.1 MAG: hypothetical protein CSA37_04550 [Candidatus Fermentibacteria bacterium]